MQAARPAFTALDSFSDKVTTFTMLIGTVVPALGVLALALAETVSRGIPFALLSGDPTTLGHLPPLAGALSTLGGLLWFAPAVVCLFVALALHGRSERAIPRFLAASGLLSGWLAFDDLFQFHEALARRWLGLGESTVYCLLVIATVVYLWRFRTLILGMGFSLLLISLVFLALSVAMDTLVGGWIKPLLREPDTLEAGAKWLGIAFWCSYHLHTAFLLLGKAVRPAPPAIR